MKYLILILVLILTFSGCGENPSENPLNNSLPSSESEEVSPESESSEAPMESEPDPEQKPLFSYLDTVDGIKMYKKAAENPTVHKTVILGTEGELNSLGEEISDEYFITDENGNPLIDHPFYDFILFPPGAAWGSVYEDGWILRGHYDGDFYEYCFINGDFVLEKHEKKGEYTLDIPDFNNTPFGYKRTRYYYGTHELYYQGVNDSEGNVIFEAIHNGMGVPFEDRFLLGTGFGDGSSPEERAFTLVDIEGNSLVQFNLINFFVFDDGSYIGIGWSAGEDGEILCYDENKNPRPLGCWFIDKDGNILSEKFRFEMAGIPRITSPDEVFTATDENGNTVAVSVKDYLCKP